MERWCETVVADRKDASLELGDDLWIALHVDGGLLNLVMMQAMMDGDYDYVCYGNFLVNLEKGKTVDWKPERIDYRFATEDEQANAYLKLAAAMA